MIILGGGNIECGRSGVQGVSLLFICFYALNSFSKSLYNLFKKVFKENQVGEHQWMVLSTACGRGFLAQGSLSPRGP